MRIIQDDIWLCTEDQTVPFSPLSPGHHVRDGHFGTRENPMVHQAVKTVFSCGPFRVHEEDRVPGRPRCWRIVEAYTGLALGSAFRLKKNAISCARSVGSRPEYLKRANRGDAHAKRVLLRLRAMYSLRD